WCQTPFSAKLVSDTNFREMRCQAPFFGARRSVVDQRDDRRVAERLAPREESELDDEREPGDDAALLPHELGRGRGRAARCDQVVDDQITCVRANRIRVHLEVIEAVLELVADADGLARQLAALAHEM